VKGDRSAGHVALAAVLLIGAAARVHGQTPSAPSRQLPPRVVEELVVTASAAPESADAVGRTVTILTADDLAGLGFVSISDALRLVPGMDVRARGPRDVQSDFSIRGATFGQSLVLLDGVRLNDSQTGHHNGDIPVPLAGIDRIEIVSGPGSAVHGADALGGTLNFLTRRGAHETVDVSAGQYGLVAAQASISGHMVPSNWTTSGWASRSGGFMTDRDFAMGGASLRGTPAAGWTIDVRHQRKAFGANGFSGASPSKEWTDQTLASLAWRRAASGWVTEARGYVRNHGDHFRWDINRPGFAENQHRTNATEGDVIAGRDLGERRRLTLGAGGGGDWVRSSNLGDHEYGRLHAFAEIQWPLAARAVLTGGLRFDDYSTFGSAWSPSLAASVWLGRNLRLRGSAAHAFRVPTFTELYYHDPANLGRPDLVAERGWSMDGGADWSRRGWTLSLSPFFRQDRDVIDWVRPTSADLWRSTNVRDVQTTGVETAVTRRFRAGLVRASVAALDVDAPSLGLQSKYVLEYVTRSIGASVTTPIASHFRVAVNVDHRDRYDGQSYAPVGAKLSRGFRRGEIYVDGTNLLNESYHEVAGVAMPGRWIVAGFALR
jgi:iron complex outermembrane receptor protein